MEKTLDLLKEYNDLGLSKLFNFDKFNQYAIVHHSASIEGSTLTESETRVLLEDGLTPKGKPLEHTNMTRDHFNALRFVLEPVNQNRRITPEFIQAINAEVLKTTGSVVNTVLGTVDTSKGEF